MKLIESALLFISLSNLAAAPVKTMPVVTSITVEVNGEARSIGVGETLAVIRGDLIKVREPDKDSRVWVNVVGFMNGNPRPDFDQNLLIDTGKDLQERWSTDKDGKTYLIKIGVDGQTIGTVTVELLEPLLEYLELQVNETVILVRPADTIQVRAKDLVKVRSVKTNIPVNDGVQVDMQIAEKSANGSPNKAQKMIRLSRRNREFAKIPVRVLH